MAGDRLVRVFHPALVALLVVSSVVAVSAQTVVDPRYVEFNASPDHSAVASDGTAIVTRYSLSFHVVGSSTAFTTVDLGKPAPGTGGIIRVDFLPLLTVTLTPGVTFEARVAAVGPGGTGSSPASNTFAFGVTACTPTISPTSRSLGQPAATGSIAVTAGTGCPWTSQSNQSWIALTGSTSGSGSGSVPYSVSQNTSTAARTGTVTVAGQTFTVTQAGTSCAYSIAPAGYTAVAGGGSGSTTVTTTSGCGWSAASNVTWMAITAGSTGTGTGTVSVSVSPNTATAPRTGTMTIAGQTFTVTQAATSCTYSIAPTGFTAVAGGGSGSTTVTTSSGCVWSAASNVSWMAVTAGSTGTGTGNVSVSVSPNTAATLRTGTMTIAGETLTITQEAATCAYSVSPGSFAAAAGGGAGSTTVTTSSGCGWSAASSASWIAVTAGATGAGAGSVSFSVAANPATAQRSGMLTVAGQTFAVTQAAASCSYSISPGSFSAPAGGGAGSTSVTTLSGCGWSGVSNAAWIAVTSGATGAGSGALGFSVSPNTTATQRSGTLTVAGRTFTVTQPGTTCAFTISPATRNISRAGESSSTVVTTASSCSWQGTASAPWITLVNGGATGSASLTYRVDANPTTSQRSGTITVGGQVHSVNQQAGAKPNSPRNPRITTASGGSQ
jgi:Viral BACON domain/Putative binding domain, N-terminal